MFQPGAGLVQVPSLPWGRERRPAHREADGLSKEQGARRTSWRRQYLKTARFGVAKGRGGRSWERHHAAAEGACTEARSEASSVPQTTGWTLVHARLQLPLGSGEMTALLISGRAAVGTGRDRHMRRPRRPALAGITFCALALGRGGQSETNSPGGPCEGKSGPCANLGFRQGHPSRQPSNLAALSRGSKKPPLAFPLKIKPMGSTPATKAAPCLPGGEGRALGGPQLQLQSTTPPALWLLDLRS